MLKAGWRLRLTRPTQVVGPVSAAPPGNALLSAQRIKLFASGIKPFSAAQVQPVQRFLFIGRDKAFLTLPEQHPRPSTRRSPCVKVPSSA